MVFYNIFLLDEKTVINLADHFTLTHFQNFDISKQVPIQKNHD